MYVQLCMCVCRKLCGHCTFCSDVKVCELIQSICWCLCTDSFSALKYQGRRLSDFAYANKPIPESKLLARPVTVHHLVCTSFNPPHFTLGKLCYWCTDPLRNVAGCNFCHVPKIKADRPLTRDTLNAPWLLTNKQFRWTGNGLSQLPLAELGKLSPNIDWFKQESINKHTLFDLALWPTTFIYSPRLAKVKVDPHAKNPGQRSNRTAPTDKRTDTHTRTLLNVLSLLLRGR